MKLLQFLIGLAGFGIAADYCATAGRDALRLGLPLSGVASSSFWLVPIAASLPWILPRRIPMGVRLVVSNLFVLGVVALPVGILGAGSRTVPIICDWPAGLSHDLEFDLGFRVLVTGDQTGCFVRFANTHDSGLVRSAIHRRALEPPQ